MKKRFNKKRLYKDTLNYFHDFDTSLNTLLDSILLKLISLNLRLYLKEKVIILKYILKFAKDN